MKSDDIRNTKLDGKPAPDVIRYNVTFDLNGNITNNIEVYTENTYSLGFAIRLGKKNGKEENNKKTLCGTDISWRYLVSSPIAHNKNQKHFGLLSPDQAIEAGGWGYLDEKDALLDKAKEAIRNELAKVIEASKSRLIQLMQPEVAKESAVRQNTDNVSEPGM